MEFELCSLYVTPSNSPNLCIYILYYVLYYISSLCSGGFSDATEGMCWFGVWWGHDTDVPRTLCARLGSPTRRVSFYASLVGGGLRLSGPSLLEYIIQSSKHLSVEYCFLFFYSGFLFLFFLPKSQEVKYRQRNKQWCSEGVAA
jgi:hypothetical protein